MLEKENFYTLCSEQPWMFSKRKTTTESLNLHYDYKKDGWLFYLTALMLYVMLELYWTGYESSSHPAELKQLYRHSRQYLLYTRSVV